MRRIGIWLVIAGVLALIYGLFLFDMLMQSSQVINASGSGEPGLRGYVQNSKIVFVGASITVIVLGLCLFLFTKKRHTQESQTPKPGSAVARDPGATRRSPGA